MSERKQTVVVTGASGFVGSALVAFFSADARYECRACFRTRPSWPPANAITHVVGDLADAPQLDEALADADIVIHTAARTHVLKERQRDSLEAYRAVNVTGTTNLALAAAHAKVRRFVYLSSIKVNGERSAVDRPFTEMDPPDPRDAYGITKWEAERALWALADSVNLPSVVLRPPLVYGPGAKGNLRRLERLIALGVPLPFKSVRNKRSMIGLHNLVSAVVAVVDHPAAIGRTFLVSDHDDLSTPQLLHAIGMGLGRLPRLWPVPVGLLLAAGRIFGRQHDIERLTGSLRVDAGAITRTIGWLPEQGTTQRLAEMARADSASAG